jgi:hypothetical protein
MRAMSTPEQPDWDQAEREQWAREEALWDQRVARREGRSTSWTRKAGALILVF